jgi:hypothetical protein
MVAEEVERPMPSRKHRSLVKLLTESPELFVDLVRRCFGFQIPDGLELLPGPETARVLASERIADGAMVVRRRGGSIVEAFVLEVQMQLDREKRKAWAHYVVGTWTRLGCPATLVVVTLSKRVARWAAEPVDIGRGQMVLVPLVVGPEQIPAEMSLEEARAWPEKLALSVIAHGHKRGSLRLGRTALEVARMLVASGNYQSRVLADLIVGFVNEGVRKIVEAEMFIDGEEWFSDVGIRIAKREAKERAKERAEGRAEGEAKGRAEARVEGLQEALWLVLGTRGLRPTAAQRARIERCRSHERLEKWLQRAVLATDVTAILRR